MQDAQAPLHSKHIHAHVWRADQSQLASVVLRAVGLNGGVDAFGGNVLWNNMEIG